MSSSPWWEIALAAVGALSLAACLALALAVAISFWKHS